MITPKERAKLRELHQKATQGEWRTGEHLNENVDKALVVGECESLLMLHEHLNGDTTGEIRRMPDLRFIVAAHNALPGLLDALDAADRTMLAASGVYAERDELRGKLDAAEAEIARLQAGGCARDQRTTQYCAEAAALAAENKRLRDALERMLPLGGGIAKAAEEALKGTP